MDTQADVRQEWREALGIDGVVLELNAGGPIAETAVKARLERLCHEEMPAFRRGMAIVGSS